MADLTITWGKCGDDNHWCDFLRLTLDNVNGKNGVYIIWSNKSIVRIGSGDIGDRITKHRKDKEITTFKDLKVTWAIVHADKMEAVEKFLANTYETKVGDRFPDKEPLSVNLPWD